MIHSTSRGRRGALVTVALAASGVACSAQVPPTYGGEPLATVHGTIVAPSASPGGDAAIVWTTTAPGRYELPAAVGTRVPVTGAFPAAFTLDLLSPPPAAGEQVDSELPAMPPVDGGPVVRTNTPTGAWMGLIAVLAPTANADDLQPGDILGVDVGHVVFYFDHDETDAATPTQNGPAYWARQYLLPATRGYHLAVVDQPTSNQVAAHWSCLNNNFCQHEVGNANAWEQSWVNALFALCTSLAPLAGTCTFDVADVPLTDADNACAAMFNEAVTSAPPCPPAAPTPRENPSGFADPSTVILGATVWDAYWGF